MTKCLKNKNHYTFAEYIFKTSDFKNNFLNAIKNLFVIDTLFLMCFFNAY